MLVWKREREREGSTVECGVGEAGHGAGDGAAEEEAEDAVLTGVGVVFVECDEDECVLGGEVLVGCYGGGREGGRCLHEVVVG